MQVFFFRFPVRAFKSCDMSSVLRVEAMRLDIRYAAQTCNVPLSDLSHPTVVPQTWAPKASRLVLAVSIKLQSFFLVSTLCFISPYHRIHCSGWSTTAVCHGVPSCRQSCSVLPLPLCSFYSGFDPKVSRQRSISSQLYHLGGRCRLECWPCVFSRRCRRFKSWTACLQGSLLALCSLRFGFVSSIFGGLKYVLPQRALVLPAMGVPY
jgi:hypothetical protein